MKLTVKLPNFTLTRGKVPSKSGGGGLRAFRRNFRKYLLWFFVGLFFFVLFAWLSLPTRAIAWRIGREARAQGYLIDVEDVSISLFGSATLENVRWTFSPSRPDQVPMTYTIEEVDVEISLLSLMAGNIDVDLEIAFEDGEDGTVAANYYKGSDESSVSLKVEGVPLYRVPKATQAINAPLRGILGIDVEMTMPEHKFGDANGSVDLTCASCTVGDGVETLFIPGSKSLKEGIAKFPEVDLGTLEGHMSIEKGVAAIDKPIETTSDDLWIELTGGLDFADPVGKSRTAMLLKFNLKDQLLARSEALDVAFKFSSEKSYLEGGQTGRGYRLEGPIAAPRFIPIQAKSRQQSRADRRAKAKERDAKRRKSRRGRSTSSKSKNNGKSTSKEKPTIGEPLDVTPIDDKPGQPGGNEPPPTEPPKEDEPSPTDSDSGRGSGNGNGQGQRGDGGNDGNDEAADEGGDGAEETPSEEEAEGEDGGEADGVEGEGGEAGEEGGEGEEAAADGEGAADGEEGDG